MRWVCAVTDTPPVKSSQPVAHFSWRLQCLENPLYYIVIKMYSTFSRHVFIPVWI
jgi:hypothetical protein